MTVAIALLGLLASSWMGPLAAEPRPETALGEFSEVGAPSTRVICAVSRDGARRIRFRCKETASGEREHEFRIVDVTQAAFTARNEAGERPLDHTDGTVSAEEGDLAYSFLWSLLQPDEEGRAEGTVGDYKVRFGGDEYGYDCNLTVDSTVGAGAISGDCEGDFIPAILSAHDIVYLELFLENNAENVLYRFNFNGLKKRHDHPTANTSFTASHSTEPMEAVYVDAATGQRRFRASESSPSTAVFFLQPSDIATGEVSLCADQSCADVLAVYNVSAYDQVAETYAIARLVDPQDPTRSGRVPLKEPLQALPNAGLAGAQYFLQTLPPDLAEMPGGLFAQGAAPTSAASRTGRTTQRASHPCRAALEEPCRRRSTWQCRYPSPVGSAVESARARASPNGPHRQATRPHTRQARGSPQRQLHTGERVQHRLATRQCRRCRREVSGFEHSDFRSTASHAHSDPERWAPVDTGRHPKRGGRPASRDRRGRRGQAAIAQGTELPRADGLRPPGVEHLGARGPILRVFA